MYQLMKVETYKVYYNSNHLCLYIIWEGTILSMMQAKINLFPFSINLYMTIQKIDNKATIIPLKSRVLRNLLHIQPWEGIRIVCCFISLRFWDYLYRIRAYWRNIFRGMMLEYWKNWQFDRNDINGFINVIYWDIWGYYSHNNL